MNLCRVLTSTELECYFGRKVSAFHRQIHSLCESLEGCSVFKLTSFTSHHVPLKSGCITLYNFTESFWDKQWRGYSILVPCLHSYLLSAFVIPGIYCIIACFLCFVIYLLIIYCELMYLVLFVLCSCVNYVYSNLTFGNID